MWQIFWAASWLYVLASLWHLVWTITEGDVCAVFVQHYGLSQLQIHVSCLCLCAHPSGNPRALQSCENDASAMQVPIAMQPSPALILHFGAVDWQAEVFLDGISVGSHT